MASELDSSSREEIEARLGVYRAQLQQIAQCLEAETNNTESESAAQLRQLRDDLRTAIALDEAILAQTHTQTHTQPASGSHQDRLILRKNAEGERDRERDEDAYSLGDLTDDDEHHNKTNTKQITTASTERAFAIGDRVLVLGGERPFAGVITGILAEDEFRIKYYEFEVEVALKRESLRHLRDPDALNASDVTLGMSVQCKYSADQQFYAATVTGLTQFGYTVVYTQYGNSEEVPLEYLHPALAKQPSSSSSKSGAGAKKSALIPIPENLQILPTDTEEEKERKKKKIKAIKNKNRLIQQDEDSKKVQQSWKKFVDKGTKRSLSGITKKSMFESSEDVTAKVGVINSGRGMTTFQERKKHKFELTRGEEDD